MAGGAYAFKAIGVFVLVRLTNRSASPLQSLVALIPAALFTALVAIQTFEADGALQFDARVGGMVAAGIAAARRAPFVLVIMVAMAATALIRWQTLV